MYMLKRFMNPSNQYSESFCSHPRLKHERTLLLPICCFIAFHQLARCDAEESSSKQAKAWTVTACTLVTLVSESPVCEMCGLRFLFAFLFRSQRGRASEARNHDKMERLTFLSFFPWKICRKLCIGVHSSVFLFCFVIDIVERNVRLPVFQAQAQTGAVTQLIQCRLSRSNMLSFAALQPVVSSVLLERSKLKVKQSKPSKPMKAKVAPGSIPNRRSPFFHRAINAIGQRWVKKSQDEVKEAVHPVQGLQLRRPFGRFHPCASDASDASDAIARFQKRSEYQKEVADGWSPRGLLLRDVQWKKDSLKPSQKAESKCSTIFLPNTVRKVWIWWPEERYVMEVKVWRLLGMHWKHEDK